MRTATKSLIFAVTCIVLSACSSPQQYSAAPTNEQEASERFIVSGSQSEVDAVIAASDSYRMISPKHHIVEVKGLTYGEIKDIAPSVNASQNHYFQALKPQKNPYQFLLADDEENPEEGNEEQPEIPAEVPPALEGCDLEATVQPTPMLQFQEGVFAENSPTMELGNTIAFSGAQSTPSVEGLDVEVRWDFLVPDASLIEQEIKVEATTEFKPDALGLYRVIMVVKDSNNACNVDAFAFLVTANPDFNLPIEGEEMPTMELEPFSQLPRVQAQESWELATGKGKTIAILDTGLNFLHPAIRFNLAVNQGEFGKTEDADDDQNNFKDDILGWDFVNGDNNPFDDEGHGSHVAGLAGSHIFGSAKDAKIMPVKVMNGAGGADIAGIIGGIYYAADNGADIINASMQRLELIPELLTAVEYAHSKGVVMIISAGNDTLDLSLDENQIYPGELDVPNVVNVAALGVGDQLASYSNFGKVETDVAAPGGDGTVPLFSLATINPRGVAFLGSGGTSMAAPIVAGIAAQVLEINSHLNPVEVRQILMESGRKIPAITETVGSGKIISALLAVQAAQQMGDAAPSPLQ